MAATEPELAHNSACRQESYKISMLKCSGSMQHRDRTNAKLCVVRGSEKLKIAAIYQKWIEKNVFLGL